MTRETLKNFISRQETFTQLKSKKTADLVVVGGGIHGAAIARLAALNGFDTVLFELNDYASGTSSRSSKMAHGGLRYLESFDFQQVFEGVKAREELLKVANHITAPVDFLIPITKGDWLFKSKLTLGLHLYDLFLSGKERRHRWIKEDAEMMNFFGKRKEFFQGGFVYSDGIINDTRFVLDTILAAREEGAICINHTSVDRVSQMRNQRVLVSCTDCLLDRKYEIEAGAVINCAGPWVPDVGDTREIRGLRSQIRYSQGTHILFNKKWNGPALLLPLARKGSYYFVWPHYGGTLVGTTESELNSADRDPLPFKEEISEIYDRLKKDLPDSGLTPENAHYCFAGIRVLPVRKKGWGGSTSQISRKHKWLFNRGVLSLIGGKLTTAYWTAYEGLKIVARLAEVESRVVSTKSRGLPGSGNLKEITENFKKIALKEGVSLKLIEGAISRLGTRVQYFVDDPGDLSWLEPIANVCLKGEILLALNVEQAENLEDIMQRRIGAELMPDHGLAGLEEILTVLTQHRPDINIESERAKYKAKLSVIKSLLISSDNQ